MEASAEITPAVVGFTITNQVEEPDFSSREPNATRWTISFTTAHGVQSSVTIPGSEYGAEAVGKAIVEKLAKIDAVHNLSTTT